MTREENEVLAALPPQKRWPYIANTFAVAVLTFVAKWMLRATGVVVQALGRRMPRNIDPKTGKDRLTGSKL